jgi:hypothetical protein
LLCSARAQDEILPGTNPAAHLHFSFACGVVGALSSFGALRHQGHTVFFFVSFSWRRVNSKNPQYLRAKYLEPPVFDKIKKTPVLHEFIPMCTDCSI